MGLSISWWVNLPGLDQRILSGYYWFLKLHQDKTELNETHWDLRATLLPLLPILFVLTHNAVQLSVVTLSHALSLSETDSTLSETSSFLISSLDKSTFERDSTPVMEGERKRKVHGQQMQDYMQENNFIHPCSCQPWLFVKLCSFPFSPLLWLSTYYACKAVHLHQQN